VKCDSVEKQQSYKLFNITTIDFSALKMFKLKMLVNIQKPIIMLLPMMSQ